MDDKSEFRPDSHYAVSKCFGESLSKLYSDKYGIKILNIRIGSALPKPTDMRFLSTWISFRDLIQLVDVGLKVKNYIVQVFMGFQRIQELGGTIKKLID